MQEKVKKKFVFPQINYKGRDIIVERIMGEKLLKVYCKAKYLTVLKTFMCGHFPMFFSYSFHIPSVRVFVLTFDMYNKIISDILYIVHFMFHVR